MNRHASVNRIYRLVWSHASNSWVPAAETARGRRKGSCKTLLAAALSLVASLAEAGPLGGQVVSGSGHIGQAGALTTITQTSSVLSLSWASFNIAPQETVDFVQPSASAIAVNRITGSNGTEILGHLEANGQVYLINPNGIVFGRGAQVDVGGLVASTLDVNEASLAGDARSFGGTGSGTVRNQGTITATGNGSGGGYVALLGNQVTNQGTISTQLGTVAMGAGSAATLTFRGDSLVHLQVDRSVLNSMAANGGLIRADGGQVLMSAGAKDALLASVVNNTGVIEARTVEDHEGTITLLGGMAAGTVNVSGTLDASAPAGGNGGFIETSAAHVEVANSAKITTAAAAGLTGSWLIDPQDFTVAGTGGDITGAALSTQLATTNVTEQSSAGATPGSGNVNINDPVSWSANTTLTLTASNNVNINSSITASGNTAGIVISPNTPNGSEAASGSGTYTLNNGAMINLPGANPSLSIAGVTYTVINTLGGAGDATTAPSTPSLQGMAATANLTGHFALGSNIDASITSTWNAGAGFTPIGTSSPQDSFPPPPSTPFSGVFDGLGHTITNLFISLPTYQYVGLFGTTGGSSTIRNVGLLSGSVSGGSYVGALAGMGYGSIHNIYTTSSVFVGSSSGGGGLVGINYGAVSNSSAAGSVSGSNMVGGLVGFNQGPISNSQATGNVSGSSFVGGLVGFNLHSITNSYATGNVTGGSDVGGLVGFNDSSITTSYATGTVNGTTSVGGLVGLGVQSSAISNSYATGTVTGSTNVGGLAGSTTVGNYGSSPIANSYATGSVTGNSNVGGLIGNNQGNISNGYATGNVSGSSAVGGLVGLNAGANGVISTVYSTGQVSGTSNVGGLVGQNSGGTITDGYWNTTISGQTTSAQSDGSYSGGGGLTTLQMQNAGYFAGFNFSTTAGAGGNSWVMVDEDGGFNNAGGYVAGQNVGPVPGATFPMLTSEYSTVIANAHQLQLMVLAPGASYTLAANINASATALGGASGGDVWSTAGGFFPVGTGGLGSFTGSFDGLGHTISNLTMAWPAQLAYVGLFGDVQPGSIIKNVGLLNASVTAIGVSPFSQPPNGTGALVGTNQGSISNSYATGTVSGSSYVGGLVGSNYGIGGFGVISNSHASVIVSGLSKVGGLAGGSSYGASISNSYATGNVSGSSLVGGLVGMNKASIANSYATGNVNVNLSDGTGAGSVGGLVGINYGSIANSYATGSVTGNTNVGGLVGKSGGIGSVTNSYAEGSVSGSSALGGLVGNNYGSVTNSFWNSDVIGIGVGANGGGSGTFTGGGGLTGGEMHTMSNFAGAGWSISNTGGGDVWQIYEGSTAPLLSSFLTPLTVTASNASTVFNGVAFTGNGVTYSATPNGNLMGTLGYGAAQGAVGAGSYAITPTGLYSTQQGYSITVASATLTITPLTVTGSINAGSSVYGSPLNPGAVVFANLISGYTTVSGATPTVSIAGNLSTSNHLNAGSYTGSESVDGALSGADASDYTFAGATGGNYTVTPLALSGSIATGSSVYGAALTPGAVSFTNLVGSDAVTAGTVTVTTTNHTSSSGNFTAGTHLGSESVGSTLSGADSGDYTFAGATGDYTVTPLALTGAIATGTSVYGSPLSPGTATLSGVIGNDVLGTATVTVNTTGLTSTSGNLTAGNHSGVEAVTALSGTDGANYTFASPTGNYTVTRLAISIAATGVNKVYDGTTTDAPTLSGSGVILGDQVTLTDAAANFASKNVGTAQTVTVSGLSIGGPDAADYVLNSATATATATISPASLTVSGLAASNKTYDGTTAAILAGGSLVGVIAVDTGLVTLTDSGSFASKNAGTGIAVTAIDTLSGSGASNYVLVQPTGLSASITPATLTYDATPATRTAGQAPTGLRGIVSGFIGTETQANDTSGTLAWTTPAEASSRAGRYAIDGSGLTATNYVFIEAPGNAAALTLQPAAVPPPVTAPQTLPPAALSVIAELQEMLLASPAATTPAAQPEELDQTATLIASAQDAGSGTLVASGSTDVDSMGSTGDTKTPSWGEYPVAADTGRKIGTTGGSLRIVSGGVRLPP